jgi:hypothetical protein
LSLLVRHRYMAERAEGPAGRWSVRTSGYVHAVLNESGRIIVAYHFHPDERSPVSWPHVHVYGSAEDTDLRRVHLPTGMVTLAAVVRLLIEELGVQPVRSDWRSIVAE